MWKDLPAVQKEEYKRMILAYASLTKMFAQKQADEETPEDEKDIPSPIINSKYQETVFQKVFHASAEDIGNTSYDVSLSFKGNDGKVHKYLIGIKTFGIGSGDQKVAQFKAMNPKWSPLIEQIRRNTLKEDGKQKTKTEIDESNRDLYLELARKIAELRNMRIKSSEANLQGFSVLDDENDIEAVYHVLMPSKKGDDPTIYVGETTYNPIDVESIEVLGCTGEKNPTNFIFTDGHHKYKYTAADSQLSMSFNNKQIVLDSWKVHYADDAYAIFAGIANDIYGGIEAEKAPQIIEEYSWLISVERYSGFNSFYGIGSKLGKGDRQKRVNKIIHSYEGRIEETSLNNLKEQLSKYFEFLPSTSDGRLEKEEWRNRIIELINTFGNKDLLADIRKILYRPIDEMYIPIPNSRRFHEEHPNFFGPQIGTFKPGTSKLAKNKKECTFDLVFEPSGERIKAFISQDDGKGIESDGKQSILGKWLKTYVFRLGEYELLTQQRLDELGINAMRLYRIEGDDAVHLQFINIEQSNY